VVVVLSENNYQTDIFKGNYRQESCNDFNVETTYQKTKVCGIFYVVLGIGGLTFSILALWYNMEATIPTYGTIMTAVLVGTISQFMLVYGYSSIRRNM
jgi:hypothetical protein